MSLAPAHCMIMYQS